MSQLDIDLINAYPANVLSNCFENGFYLDGVWCASVTSFLHALKFQHLVDQVIVCSMPPEGARHRSMEMDVQYKITQKLWWQSVCYPRTSREYQQLLDRIFHALINQNQRFAQALKDSFPHELTYQMGRNQKVTPVLTEEEFCSKLMRLRGNLLARRLEEQRLAKKSACR